MKRLVYSLLFFACATLLSVPVFAMFSSFGNSNGNEFRAGTLDLTLTASEFSTLLAPAGTANSSTVLQNLGTILSQYLFDVENMSGNFSLCDAISVEARGNGVKKYDGLLLDMKVGTSTAPTTWRFAFSLSPEVYDVAHGDLCEADVVFHGWQKNGFLGVGFSDEARYHVKITAKMIVLNEFLPNPEGILNEYDFGEDADAMPKGEWVELYNNSNTPYDISGWSIRDNVNGADHQIAITSDNTQPATTIIPANGFLVVFMNKELFDNEGGDSVKLFNANGVLMDSYAYLDDAPPNKTYARIPDGIGDFVDPIPTPGKENLLNE